MDYSTNDHDLLIELKTEIVGLRKDINEMKDDTKSILADHEIRIRFIERYMWLAVGMVTVLEIGFGAWSALH